MKTIGLIAAMPQESNAFLRYIKGGKRVALGKLACKSFELYEHNCLLVTSGMGMRRAKEAAQALVESYAPQVLISFGIAGAVEADLDIGDVVVPEGYYELAQGVPGPLRPLNLWPDNALKAAAFGVSGRGARLVTGTAVTTGSTMVLADQLSGLKHPILEMETAGIAQVAAQKGIPFLCIRAISDGPRTPIPFELNVMMDKDANLQIGRILMQIARHPGIILKLSGLMRNSRLAADNAAFALINALGSQDI